MELSPFAQDSAAMNQRSDDAVRIERDEQQTVNWTAETLSHQTASWKSNKYERQGSEGSPGGDERDQFSDNLPVGRSESQRTRT